VKITMRLENLRVMSEIWLEDFERAAGAATHRNIGSKNPAIISWQRPSGIPATRPTCRHSSKSPSRLQIAPIAATCPHSSNFPPLTHIAATHPTAHHSSNSSHCLESPSLIRIAATHSLRPTPSIPRPISLNRCRCPEMLLFRMTAFINSLCSAPSPSNNDAQSRCGSPHACPPTLGVAAQTCANLLRSPVSNARVWIIAI
jgi:hypothetical protein